MLFEGPKHKHLKCGIFRGPGGAGNATTDSEITLLTQLGQSASTSAASATTSATNAATSASQAATSASNAASSASSASTSASNAAGSATAAASSATNAASSATAAGTSATNAANSATAASTSASNAASSATAAAGSASSASTSATNAANSASAAATSETNAAASASSASSSASSASTSATNAANSASTASTAATNASNSASAAATSATSASGSASSASTSATNAAASATAALASENNAASSASSASSSASSASSSATSASNSASSASTSATNAANSASAASTSASNAASSASAAATSAFNAATSESNAAASAAAAATFDPALYLAKADNLSGLANTATARTNLGVAIGSDVQAYSANLAGYAATGIGFRNRIINGDMRIDQRNAGAEVTVGPSLGGALYTLDRWLGFASSTRTFKVQRGTTAPTGFTNSAQLTVGVSGSPSAAEQNLFAQNIEGFNTADLGWGTASAQAVTISFWVRSSVTGTYGFGVHNSNGSRCYVATYVVNSANTWEYKTIVVPGDTSGTWLTNNGIGVNIRFDLGSGSNYNGTADTWSGSFVWRTSGCVNWIANAGATLNITGVQLEAGSVATPFERRPYGTELALAQRYYQVARNVVQSATTITSYHKVSMRASPTVTGGGSGFTVTFVNTETFGAFQTTTAQQDLVSSAEL